MSFWVTSYTTKNIKILNKKKMKTKPDSDNAPYYTKISF